jgi:UDP:flavonoid glycosyltransferase YjiC (YdhE family)
MLLYPLNEKVDQNGNSIRIEKNGFGIIGNVYYDKEENIRQKILELLSNNKYRNSIVLSKTENKQDYFFDFSIFN